MTKLQIGNLTLPNKVLCCPIAGYSDAAYRTIMREHTDSLMFAEMVSVTGLSRQSEGSIRRLELATGHHPLGVQLFGCKPRLFYEAARKVEAAGFDLVDVNFGCPKVPGEQLAGSKLMRYPRLIAEIVRNMRKAVTIPVSVKMRAGFCNTSLNAANVARIAESEGANMVTVHGRTCRQRFKGSCNWEWIKETVEAVSIPVIANGDITTPQGAREILDYTKAAGVMIGRAGLGRQWLIRNMALYLEGREVENPPGFEEMRELVLRHLEYTKELLGKKYLRQVMRRVVSTYFKGVPGVKKLRRNVHRVKTYPEIRDLLKAFQPEREILCK